MSIYGQLVPAFHGLSCLPAASCHGAQPRDCTRYPHHRSSTHFITSAAQSLPVLEQELVLGSLRVISLKLILSKILYTRNMESPFFAKEEPEAQRGEVICPRSHSQLARDLERGTVQLRVVLAN